MLFNSYVYLLLFLPLVVLGFHLLRGAPWRVGISFLVIASLVYYAYWDWTNLWIIGASCVGNFLIGRHLASHRGSVRGKCVLVAGVVANLALLGFYKYAGFLAKGLDLLTAAEVPIPAIVLPLGISFFTFQQVAYLVDAWKGESEEYHFSDYLLFVTFFPQLIAGPIVHHREMLPQFRRRGGRGVRSTDLAVGLTILTLGLFKKVVMADRFAGHATPLFDAAHAGEVGLTCGEAWGAALAYTLQIYFDFSGYSDIAIGSARLFGIRLPVNFHSPYKATSIIDFWRRWHITLSRFLRDYLYIPLGGNRRGPSRRYVNLMVTMLLGGLWHGAGLTFLLWGALHGLALCVNHAWHWLARKTRLPRIPRPLGVALTFLFVVIAWIPFRAGNYESVRSGSLTDAWQATWRILSAMFTPGPLWSETSTLLRDPNDLVEPLLAGLLMVWAFPNTQQFMRRYFPALGLEGFEDGRRGRRRRWQWRPTLPWLVFTLIVLLVVCGDFDKISEFIYFQF